MYGVRYLEQWFQGQTAEVELKRHHPCKKLGTLRTGFSDETARDELTREHRVKVRYLEKEFP
jgi:hypothetical protein